MGGEHTGDSDDHTENAEFVCVACERTFESEAARDRHVRDVGLVH
ncbi:hypothetical protein ACFPYI_15605 [Halomarina salina]|uniref:C2H2-type domain-containing protein n=1 Tax=Halomarina salina TaxID=1872699 RepID=A0ABD5RQV1_9EURY|nr:C2H2-type zinc finger protein [Halomarina salina]